MTLMGRDMPELPPEVLFSDIEIEVLRAYAKKNINLPCCLGSMVKLVLVKTGIGSKDWGAPWPLQRSACRASVNVERLFSIATHV